MDRLDPILERAAETLREPVRLDPRLDRKIMDVVERGGVVRRLGRWLTSGRTVMVSPLGGVGFATAIAILLLAEWWWITPRDALREPVAAAGAEVVQFVLVAPEASEVALVGDFNDWSRSATQMQSRPGSGMWTVTVPLEPGRYRYAFVVDGATWVRDPTAPRAIEDDFGRPNSVLTVRGT